MSTQYEPSLFAAFEHMGRSEDLNRDPHLVHKLAVAWYRLAPVVEQLRQDVAA